MKPTRDWAWDNLDQLMPAKQARDNVNLYLGSHKAQYILQLNNEIVKLSRDGKRSIIINKDVANLILSEIQDAGYMHSWHQYGPKRETRLLIEW